VIIKLTYISEIAQEITIQQGQWISNPETYVHYEWRFNFLTYLLKKLFPLLLSLALPLSHLQHSGVTMLLKLL
jgi:hypothetical protein